MSSDSHARCLDILKTILYRDGKRLLAGYYDPAQRRLDVETKLDNNLKIFESTDFLEGPLDDEYVNGHHQEKTLDTIQVEIDVLKNDVTVHTFNGHFTKDYRTFEGTCLKLQQTIDNFNHQNNPDIRKWRRKAIREVQNILDLLSTKVHQDGKCCKECELHGTQWQ